MESEIQSVNISAAQQAWEYMKEINENVRHYNDHQTKYRTLASQWLLGAFAGIGFIFYSEASIPFHKLWMVLAICLASSLGIYQLWRMDMIIFQRLLGAYFSAGITIEDNTPNLPQIKKRILEVIPYHNVGETLFHFYFFMIAVLLTVGSIGLVYIGRSGKNAFFAGAWFALICMLALAVVLLVMYRHMRLVSKGPDSLPQR